MSLISNDGHYLDAAGKKRRLSKKTRECIDLMVNNGLSCKQASELAGISAYTWMTQQLKKPECQEYMRRATAAKLETAAVAAAHTVQDLSQSAKSEYVKLQAAQDLLTRVGYAAPEKHQHRVDGEIRIEIDLS